MVWFDLIHLLLFSSIRVFFCFLFWFNLIRLLPFSLIRVDFFLTDYPSLPMMMSTNREVGDGLMETVATGRASSTTTRRAKT